MNVLILAGEIPYPPHGGSRMRLFQFIRALSERHRITLLAFQYGAEEQPAISALGAWCRVEPVAWREPALLALMRRGALVSQLAYGWALLSGSQPFAVRYFHTAAMAARVRARLKSERWDILHVEDSVMMALVPARTAAPIVLSIQNVEYWRAERSPGAGRSARIEQAKLRRFERQAFTRAAACCPTSALEAEHVRRLAPDARVKVIANGVDTTEFAPGGALVAQPTVVFTGTLSYAPNADGILWFSREVWPLVRARQPSARLLIVGREPPAAVRALASECVTVTGEVPDVRPFLRSARVAIAPVRSGGGTRLKILEALACALPVVSTTIGAEGLDLAPGEHILIADDAPSFAAAVARLLVDSKLCAALGAAGRARVAQRYDWRQITGTLDRVYHEAAARA